MGWLDRLFGKRSREWYTQNRDRLMVEKTKLELEIKRLIRQLDSYDKKLIFENKKVNSWVVYFKDYDNSSIRKQLENALASRPLNKTKIEALKLAYKISELLKRVTNLDNGIQKLEEEMKNYGYEFQK